MAHVTSDNVNEKSYILDARKNFEDVSKPSLSPSAQTAKDVIYHILIPFFSRLQGANKIVAGDMRIMKRRYNKERTHLSFVRILASFFRFRTEIRYAKEI